MKNLQRIYRYIGICLGILLTTFTLYAQKNAVKLGSGSRIQNCIVWGNTDCDRQVNVPALFSFIEGIQTGMPGFADVMNGDFLLRYDSPCRNAGSAEGITLPSFDLWGNRRLAGKAVDMGAHEYSSYKISFQKNALVEIEEAVGCDSNAVEPGADYKFRVLIGDTWNLRTVYVNDSKEKLQPGEEGFYTVKGVSHDMTLVIVTDPPLALHAVASSYGGIRIKYKGEEKQTDRETDVKLAVDSGDEVEIDTFSFTGYRCIGLWAQREGEEAQNLLGGEKPLKYSVTKNTTLTATFATLTYKLTVETVGDGALTIKDRSGHVYSSGDRVSFDTMLLVSVQAGPGSELTDVQANGISVKVNMSKKVDGPLTIKGIFALKKFKVDWQVPANGNQLQVTLADGNALPANKQVDYGTVIKIAWQSAEGYSLSALKAGNHSLTVPPGGIDGSQLLTVVQDTALTASFTKKKYRVDWEVNPSGNILKVSANGKNLNSGESVEYGTVLEVLPEAMTGYDCVSLTRDNDPKNLWDAASHTVSIPDIRADIWLHAEFQPENYTVSYNTPAHGSLKIEKGDGTDWTAFTLSGQTFAYGQQLRVTATPEEGYRLKTLTQNHVDITSGWTAQPATDQVIYAEFEPITFTVTFQKKGVDPEKAILQIFDKSTGNQVLSLPKGTTQDEIVDIPYGTQYRLAPVLEEGYVATLSVLEEGEILPQNITASLGYEVRKNATITMETAIDPSFYPVSWEATGGEIEVFKSVAGDLTSGSSVKAGTSLNVSLTPEPGYVLKSLTINGEEYHQKVEQWNVNGIVHFKVEFVPGHLVTYDQPSGGSMQVKAGSRVINSGDRVPEGTVLSITLVRTDPAYKCFSLESTMGGTTDPLWHWMQEGMALNVTRQTAAVTDDIHLTGLLKKYYSFIYRKPLYGALAVLGDATGTIVPVNKTYELPEGLQLMVEARENVVGYHFEQVSETIGNQIVLSADNGENTVYRKRITIDRAMDLSALFVIDKYTVTVECSEGGGYVVAGGTFLGNDLYEVEYGQTFQVTTHALSEDYRLVSFTCNGVVAEPGEIRTIRENTVYQIVYGKLYRVTYQTGGPEGILKVTDESGRIVSSGDYQPEGLPLKVVAEVRQEGYRCTSLKVVDKSGAVVNLSQITGSRDDIFAGTFTMPANDVTAAAVFEIKTCRVVYEQPGHGELTVTLDSDGTMIPANSKIPYGTVIRVTVVPENDTYECKQMVLTEGETTTTTSKTFTYRVTDDVSVQAQLELKQWPLFIEVHGEGRLEVSDNNGKSYFSGGLVPVGTPLTIRAVTTEGYTYTITGNGELLATDQTALKMMPNNNLYLTADFILKQYPVNLIQPSEGGDLVVNRADGSNLPYGVTMVDYGTELTVAGIAGQGFALQHLMVNTVPQSSPYGFAVYEATVLEAVFSPVYKVEYVQPEHGEIVVEADGKRIASGTTLAAGTSIVVTLVEGSEAYQVDYLRINEQEHISGEVWNLTEDAVITAALSIKRYPVTYDIPEHATIEVKNGEKDVENGEQVEYGTVLTVTVTADEGWQVYTIHVEGAALEEGRVEVKAAVHIVPEIREIIEYLFPVVFTPNGDGVNDTWEIKGLWACPENRLEIYNRQGKRIYVAEPYDNEWDGKTDKGDLLPAGNYVYIFKIKDGETYQGIVSIIRK